MAGRKQHYLPQHLLRGFEASKAGKKVQVVVYKKGTTPYTTSTEGVAAQRDFYSSPGDGVTDTLDDVITAFERNTFNPFLDLVRKMPSNEQVDAESAASAVVHLTVRAAHLRGSFAKLAQKMFAKLDSILNDPALVREFVDIDSASKKSVLSEELQKTFDALSIENLPLKERLIFEKMMRFRVREKFDVQMLEFAPLLREQLSMLEGAFPNMVVRSHNQALKKSLVPAERIKKLEKLYWRVVVADPPSHFVLPDCAAIAFTSSGQLQPLAMTSSEEVTWVAMPINAKQVLIGCADQEWPTLSSLNECFIRCSLEFFVSSGMHSDAEALTGLMGAAIEIATNAVMEESFTPALPKPRKINFKNSVPNVRIVSVGIKLGVHNRMAVNRMIKQVFAQQCGAREAKRLESIVIASDVAREVATLHGRALLPYEAAVTVHGAVEPIFGAVPVVFRLFLPESIGQFLLGADLRLKQEAILQIKYLLGRVSYLDHWFGDIAPIAEGNIFKHRQIILLELTSRFASHYYGSIKAASIARKSDLKDNESKSVHVVATAFDVLEAARQKFMSHKNVDALLADVVPALDMLFETLARYCGQHAHGGSNSQRLQTSTAFEKLFQPELWDWMNLFKKDLYLHYQSLKNESFSLDQVLALSEHVERLLWNFGLILSDVEDGRVWIDACNDEQLKMVKQMLHS